MADSILEEVTAAGAVVAGKGRPWAVGRDSAGWVLYDGSSSGPSPANAFAGTSAFAYQGTNAHVLLQHTTGSSTLRASHATGQMAACTGSISDCGFCIGCPCLCKRWLSWTAEPATRPSSLRHC